MHLDMNFEFEIELENSLRDTDITPSLALKHYDILETITLVSVPLS